MDASYINKVWTDTKDKQVAMTVIRAEVLAENIEELKAQMALKEIKEDSHGYSVFAHNFVSIKIRDARLQGVQLAKGIA